MRQDHGRAADLLAEAAATPGLSTAMQWQHQIRRVQALETLG